MVAGTVGPEWQRMAVYAVAAAVVLFLLQRIPFVGRIVSALLSLALLAFCIFLLIQQAPFEPTLARISERIGIDQQKVVGEEVRIRMAPNGHFWADVSINGTPRRMLIDSGATVTALSDRTAAEAGVESGAGLLPVMVRTANGVTQARTGTVRRLRVGDIEASNLKVIISPGFDGVDVLGMNFLSQLASWRVEGRTLVLVPERKAAEGSSAD